MPAAGGAASTLTSGPFDSSPTWAPDGQWIAYDSAGEFNLAVFKVPAGGGEPVRIAPDEGETEVSYATPAWSPDGTLLGCHRPRRHMGHATGWKHPPTRHSGDVAFRPAWSPDGRMIAFVKSDGIYLAEADGSDERRITTTCPQIEPDIDFSPDGDWLVFDDHSQCLGEAANTDSSSYA